MRFVWSIFAELRGARRASVVAVAFAAGLISVRPAAAGLISARPAAADEAQAEARAWSATSSLAASPAPPGLYLVWGAASEAPAAALDRLERAGFDVAVAVPPHLYYVRRGSRSGSILPAGFAFAATPEGPRGTAPAPQGPLVGRSGSPDMAADLFFGIEDAFPPVVRGTSGRTQLLSSPAGTLQGLPFGARWFDTSEFMIGRVAVPILFPESDGSTDVNRYDWTPALRDSVVRSAVRGLAHWSVFAARRGIALSFVIEVHPGLATRYEPISRTVAEEENWIQDVLVSLLGYRRDALTLCYDVANAARARLGAQWAALVFAVQNDSSSTGTFADGIIAHARLGGPYFVTPVKNGGAATQGASLDNYIEHEMAHAFWALDEHLPSSGWWACSLTSGYLNISNYNSYVPADGYCTSGVPGVHCLMRGNYPDDICVYTEGQIGWADRNSSGVPDLLETRPVALPDSGEYRAVAGPPVTLRGRALEIAALNRNPYHYGFGDSISIATIDSVRYRVDGGPPQMAAPLDGAYDSGREYFTAALGPLPPGDYLVEWEAYNSNGLPNLTTPYTAVSLRASSSPASVEEGTAASRGISLRLGPSPSDGAVRFRLRAEPRLEGRARIYDVAGRRIAQWTLRMPSSGTLDWRWDGRVGGGASLPSGLYFATIEMGGRSVTRRLVISR